MATVNRGLQDVIEAEGPKPRHRLPPAWRRPRQRIRWKPSRTDVLIVAALAAIALFSGFAALGGAAFATTVTFTAGELLGKPTDSSITVNVVPAAAMQYYYRYGTTSGVYKGQTEPVTATGGQPSEVTITGLTADAKYYYQLVYDGDGSVTDGDFETRPEQTFHTARAAGDTFTFDVTSDAHGGGASTWTSVLNELPDFDVDLGDTFGTDSLSSQSAVNNVYLTQRGTTLIGKAGPSVPIFLAAGNHENEEGWNLDDTPFSQGVGNIQARKLFFPTPTDGGFYSGNNDPLSYINATTYGDQLREDYYAWTWGDALFVVIDEFQYTMNLSYAPAAGEGSDDSVTGDQWSWTLGKQQYDWLKATLEGSDTKYKFVFSHNMVGGIPRGPIGGAGAGYVRGGAEAAAYFEWGGKNADGTDGFATNRPGWGETIEQLFEDNGVSAYFHGHDHQYVYETRDGIVYQELPSAGIANAFSGVYTEGVHTGGAAGDYNTVKVATGQGHLRISVSPTKATVDYVLMSNGSVNYSYDIAPNATGPTHDLTLAASPSGSGTTSPAAGVHSYASGTVVPLSATPAPGYVFDHWSGDVASASSASTSVTMDEAQTVTAVFVEQNFDLTLKAGWNLVAAAPGTLFPTSLWGWNGQSYTSTSEPIAWQGFWCKVGAEQAVDIKTTVGPHPIDLAEGWNLIGNSMATPATLGLPSGLVAWTYDATEGTYASTTSALQPGQGAWVKATAGQQMTLTSSGG
jgi:Divergent InlB B-repeat domain/Calcineurin-like phosphoesterase